jgi:hypothetical protein
MYMVPKNDDPRVLVWHGPMASSSDDQPCHHPNEFAGWLA